MTLMDEKRFPLRFKNKLGISRTKATLRKWITVGIESPITGELVKLEGLFEGQGYTTSPEAVKRFLAKLNGIELPKEAVS